MVYCVPGDLGTHGMPRPASCTTELTSLSRRSSFFTFTVQVHLQCSEVKVVTILLLRQQREREVEAPLTTLRSLLKAGIEVGKVLS